MFRPLLILSLAATALGCGARDRDRPLRLFAAASTAEAVEAVAAAFQDAYGTPVQVNLASSAILAKQLAAGAEGDVFLSASGDWADFLADEGLVLRRRDLLANHLVVVAPADGRAPLSRPEDLLRDDVRRVAVGNPESVPAGQYARQALTRLGLWHRLQPKCVSGGDVRQTLFFVERGEADAGIVYATDAAVAPGVCVAFELDLDPSDPIRYPAVLLKRNRPHPAAERFYEFLASPQAEAIFTSHGFQPVP